MVVQYEYLKLYVYRSEVNVLLHDYFGRDIQLGWLQTYSTTTSTRYMYMQSVEQYHAERGKIAEYTAITTRRISVYSFQVLLRMM
jgi:hypothetical protein